MNKVSFQGEHGAYSESAARKYYVEDIETEPCNTFDAALENTKSGKSNFSILPVENSIEGTVGQSIDAITKYKIECNWRSIFKSGALSYRYWKIRRR